jgi:predicted O-methyltransferase YrrM
MKMFSFSRVAKGAFYLLSGSALQKRRTVHEIVRIFAQTFGGHYVGEDCKLWLSDEAFVARYKALSPHNHFSMERKFALKELARSVRDLPGAVAECGCYVGVSAWFMANEIAGADFFLFDSFEGLSAPEGFDQSPEGLQQWRAGDLATSEDVLRENLRGFENIHVLKGWIPERFAEVGDRLFKLVHIDVDLYAPTRDSLAFFYERMVPGGIIVMDDYGFANCPGAHRAANAFMATRPESIIHLPTGQGVIIRR